MRSPRIGRAVLDVDYCVDAASTMLIGGIGATQDREAHGRSEEERRLVESVAREIGQPLGLEVPHGRAEHVQRQPCALICAAQRCVWKTFHSLGRTSYQITKARLFGHCIN